MKLLQRSLTVLTCILLLTSCGVITRARYGNGLKLNLENRWFGKKDVSPAKKKEYHSRIAFTPVAVKNDSAKTIISEPVSELHGIDSISTGSSLASRVEKKLAPLKKLKEEFKPLLGKKLHKADYDARPMEPNAKWAGILFYGGLAISYLASFAGAAGLASIAGIAMIIGIILAFVAIRRIRLTGFAFRGYGLALSIVILFYIELLIFLLYLFLILFLIASI